MRVLGVLVLIFAVLLLFVSMSMNVSVSTGMGRVNNIGLMADRQNLTMIGGVALIAGLLMLILGGKGRASPTAIMTDLRDCPLCAETIKRAAVKCKHCGADVEPEKAPRLLQGWVARVSCRDEAERDRATQCLAEIGLSVVPMMGMDVGAGPYPTKAQAKTTCVFIGDSKKLHADTVYRDIVTGTYPPL